MTLPDKKNPEYIFQLIDTDILLIAVNGKMDLLEMARKELAARGIDKDGVYVGFKAAKNCYGV